MSIINNTQHRADFLAKLVQAQNIVTDLQILIDIAMQQNPSQTAVVLLAQADVHLAEANTQLGNAAIRVARLP